jgi:hypothetical protein
MAPYVCYLYADPGELGQSCAPAADLAAGILMGASDARGPIGSPSAGIRVFGVMPDGVKAVELSLASGHSQRARVRDNGYLVVMSDYPKLMDWDWRGKHHRLELVLR